MSKNWAELTGKEFESIAKDVAILPVGAIERHGDHLPLGTDSIIPEWIANEVSKRLENSIVLPTIYYGSTLSLSSFPGTIDTGDEAFKNYVKAIMYQIFKNGFKILVVINGHGGNTNALSLASKEVSYGTDKTIIIVDWWSDVAQDERSKLFKFPGHAGEDETSVMLAIRPELVKLEYTKKNIVSYPKFRIYSRKVDQILYPEAVSGDPSFAEREKGKIFLDAVVNEIVKIVNEAKLYYK